AVAWWAGWWRTRLRPRSSSARPDADGRPRRVGRVGHRADRDPTGERPDRRRRPRGSAADRGVGGRQGLPRLRSQAAGAALSVALVLGAAAGVWSEVAALRLMGDWAGLVA